MSLKKAAIFDLDGTLLDTLPDLTSAVNRATAKLGLPAHTCADVRSFIGNGALVLMSRASGLYVKSDECRDLRIDFTAEYKKHLFDNTLPYEGIPELVKKLAGSGVSVAVVSNKDDACVQILMNEFFGGDIKISRGVRDESERKPDPKTTFEVLCRLGITPDQAVFIGDSRTDQRTAAASGIDHIPVSYGYTDADVLRDFCGVDPVPDVKTLSERLYKLFGIE